MRVKMKKTLMKITAAVALGSYLISSASAIIKEVAVGGAWSINDLGQSDNRVSMEQVKQDYAHFKQTSWLTEYFHRDQEAPDKIDFGEALSWLIDNEIVNRDKKITISNIYPADTQQDQVPVINIEKVDPTDYLGSKVSRSDMIMYLYKAVYGSLDARTIGVETPNTRIDNMSNDRNDPNYMGGFKAFVTDRVKKRPLYQIMKDHDYFTTQTMEDGIHQSAASGGSASNQVVDNHAIPLYTANNTTVGGVAGEQTVTTWINTSSRWRYSPQGDEYESIFGDTNIFISDVDIAQNANTGTGTQIDTFIDFEAHSASTMGSHDIEGSADSHVTNGNNNHATAQIGTGGTGGVNNAIQYETDYKQIYYAPGADLMFYRADDCLELYLQNALSKGLLTRDDVIRTDKFNEVFVKSYTNSTSTLHTWSPVAYPYIPNRKYSILNRPNDEVKRPSDSIYAKCNFYGYGAQRPHNILGDNYRVTFTVGSPATLEIERLNLFNGNTGYFDSEEVSRMQFYKYIYSFLGADEKKLSDMELDIINYKYSMQLDNLGDEEEVRILKYLTAKGILDYTSNYDYTNLNSKIVYDDFFPILYRVANPNARLDFSKVQLTDSETQWKNDGYASKDVAIVEGNVRVFTGVEEGDGDDVTIYSTEVNYEQPMSESNISDIVNALSDDQFVTYSSNDIAEATALLDQVALEEIDGRTRVALEDPEANKTTVKTSEAPIGPLLVDGFSFDFRGAFLSATGGGTSDAFSDLPAGWPSSGRPDNNVYRAFETYFYRVVTDSAFMKAWEDECKKEGVTFGNLKIAKDLALSGTYAGGVHNPYYTILDNSDKFTGGSGSNYIDLIFGFCNNIYVMALIQQHPEILTNISNNLSTIIDVNGTPWRNIVEKAGDFWGSPAAAGSTARPETRIECLANHLLATLKNNSDSLSNIQLGELAASGGVSLTPGGIVTPTFYHDMDEFAGSTSGREHLLEPLNRLQTISFDTVTNGSYSETCVVTRAPGTAKAGSTVRNMSNDVLLRYVNTMQFSTGKQFSEKGSADFLARKEKAMNNAARSIDDLSVQKSFASGSVFNAQASQNGTSTAAEDFGSFISWASIEAKADLLGIVRISDCLLYNSITDTYAYFPADGVNYKYALVGTAILQGDANDGVAKVVEGQKWYWAEAIKLLIGIQDESAILNTVQGMSLPQESVQKHAQNMPLSTESGYQASRLNGLRFRLGTSAELASIPKEYQIFVNNQEFVDPLDSTKQWRWGNYITASKANRVVNMVNKKVTQTNAMNTNSMSSIYSMVFLKPQDLSGTAEITESMTMEETLDCIAREPKDEAARNEWHENKQICNDFLNWMYGTSGVEYVNTGYLKPEVHIYCKGQADVVKTDMTDGDLLGQIGAVTDAMKHYPVNYHGLNQISMGLVDYCGTQDVVPAADIESDMDDRYFASYWVGSDYRVIVVDDRLLIHEKQIPELTGFMGTDHFDDGKEKYCLKTVNQMVAGKSFYVGQAFNLGDFQEDKLANGATMPQLTVIGTGADGTVTAQIGPLSGMPLRQDGGINILNSLSADDDMTVAQALSSENTNMWLFAKNKMIDTAGGIKWLDEIVEEPILRKYKDTDRYGVYNGKHIRVYEGDGLDTLRSEYPMIQSKVESTQKLKDAEQSLNDALISPTYGFINGNVNNIESYAKVQFSAYEFAVINGVLCKRDLEAGHLYSPSLFICVNDLIIEQMLADSDSAIPVNQIEEGSLVEIGDAWYIAANSDEKNKVFVGYAPLTNYTQSDYSITVQDAARSMASHFVRGGNQYINITHYITKFTVLDNSDGNDYSYSSWKKPLSDLARLKMKENSVWKRQKLAALGKCNIVQTIDTGETPNQDIAVLYAPVALQFDNNLLAYMASPKEETNKTYKICNYVKKSSSGALANVTFFNDDLYHSILTDKTTNILSGNYVHFEGAREIMETLKQDFQKAFAGDLFTLARLILFIILIWLFVMSWVCYAFYASRLMPLVDAICHPTNDRNTKGIDLFKIFSLGTISVDSDFKLGRFLQYDFIIAILILVVWKSGNITF